MRKQRELTEQEKRDVERFKELMAKESNKKLNRTQDIVSWLKLVSYGLIIWLLWDIFHWTEYIFVEWRLTFGIVKFLVATILLIIADSIQQK